MALSRAGFVVVVVKSDIEKSTEWSTRPACPSLMCLLFFLFFLNRGSTEGIDSSKNCLFDVYVCFVICKFLSGLILCVCFFFFF